METDTLVALIGAGGGFTALGAFGRGLWEWITKRHQRERDMIQQAWQERDFADRRARELEQSLHEHRVKLINMGVPVEELPKLPQIGDNTHV